jgi:hypothetical protein
MRTPSPASRFVAAAACVSAVLGLHAQTAPPTPTAHAIRDAPAEWKGVISRADVIIATMHDALLWELNSGLEQGGAILAIKSCHIDAARVAERIGRQEGVAAGRTSDRLRNPLNVPRRWAAPIVAANAGRRARDVDGFVVDLGRELGVMRPVALRPTCAGCHGRPDTFNAAIRAELRERYPMDRATGFEEGEIRGWYWVQLPKRPR